MRSLPFTSREGGGRELPKTVDWIGSSRDSFARLRSLRTPWGSAAHTWASHYNTENSPTENSGWDSLYRGSVVVGVIGPCRRHLIGKGTNNTSNLHSTGKDGFHADGNRVP